MNDPAPPPSTCCSKAHTVDDAAMLLDALGLVADGTLTWPTVPAGLEPRNPRNIAATTGPGAGNENPPPVILHPDDVCHCRWALDDNHIRGCTNTDCGCLIHCVDEDAGWTCLPRPARRPLRHPPRAHRQPRRHRPGGMWRTWT